MYDRRREVDESSLTLFMTTESGPVSRTVRGKEEEKGERKE